MAESNVRRSHGTTNLATMELVPFRFPSAENFDQRQVKRFASGLVFHKPPVMLVMASIPWQVLCQV